MIELDDKSYIVGIWFSSSISTNNDWMACVIRDPENPACYKGWSRFRTAKDDKIWDSEDEKRWSKFKTQEAKTEEEIIKHMNDVQQSLSAAYRNTDKILVKGNLKKMIGLSKDKDWLNIKQV
jgi:predicted DsbA family dithiol-disulfide isomerase